MSGLGSDALTWRKKEGIVESKAEKAIKSQPKIIGSVQAECKQAGSEQEREDQAKKALLLDLDNSMEIVEKDKVEKKAVEKRGAKGIKRGTYKRQNRVSSVNGGDGGGAVLLGKRGLEDEEIMENENVKKVKADNVEYSQGDEFSLLAGPANWSCEAQ